MKLLKWALHYMYNLRNIETSDTAASTGLKPDINHPWRPFVVYSKNKYRSINYVLSSTCTRDKQHSGVFPKWSRMFTFNSVNSGNLIKHSSMNWAEFKDPLSHVCLAGTVVASWSLTQEVAG